MTPDDALKPAPPPRGPALVAKPWFWALFVGVLFVLPLIKGLGAEFPDPLPGADGPAMEFALPDEHGELVSLADLQGYLVIVTELPLANGQVRETTMRGLRALRKRLRGLGSTVVFVSLCHGGEASELTQLLDTWTARKPVNVFLLDEDHAVMDELRAYGKSPSADWFLIDRHSRIRGVYGVEEAEASLAGEALERNTTANEAEVDRLVVQAGQLANWMGSDEAPEG